MKKLKAGAKFRVHGWVMLEKLDEGDYRIKSIYKYLGHDVARITKPRGNKVLVRHTLSNLNMCLREENDPDINKITRL